MSGGDVTPSQSEIVAQIAAGEGEQTAFFRDRPRIDELAESLAALANRNGGVAIIGINGRGRPKIEGIGEPAEVAETVLSAAD